MQWIHTWNSSVIRGTTRSWHVRVWLPMWLFAPVRPVWGNEGLSRQDSNQLGSWASEARGRYVDLWLTVIALSLAASSGAFILDVAALRGSAKEMISVGFKWMLLVWEKKKKKTWTTSVMFSECTFGGSVAIKILSRGVPSWRTTWTNIGCPNQWLCCY